MRRPDPENIYFVSVGDSDDALGACMIYAHSPEDSIERAKSVAPESIRKRGEDKDDVIRACSQEIAPESEENGRVGMFVIGRWYNADECRSSENVIDFKPPRMT